MKKSIPYREFLMESIREPKAAAAYLNAVLETGDLKVFLKALRNVAAAHGGLTHLSRRTRLHRQSLYRMLAETGNPEITSLQLVLQAMGLGLQITSTKPLKKAA